MKEDRPKSLHILQFFLYDIPGKADLHQWSPGGKAGVEDCKGAAQGRDSGVMELFCIWTVTFYVALFVKIRRTAIQDKWILPYVSQKIEESLVHHWYMIGLI